MPSRCPTLRYSTRATLIAAVLLSSCGLSNDLGELEAFVERAHVPAEVRTDPPLTLANPETSDYQAGARRSPFDPSSGSKSNNENRPATPGGGIDLAGSARVDGGDISLDFQDIEPLATEFIRVRYANAGRLLSLFLASDSQGSVLSNRGAVIVDDRTNSIVLTDSPANIQAFRRLIEQLDVPLGQVLIESRIVTVSKNVSQQLGIRWGGGYVENNGASELRIGGSLTTLGELRQPGAEANEGIVLSLPEGLVVDVGVPRSDATRIGVGMAGDGYLIDLELSALAAEGIAEVVARPQVVTADKTLAVIESGVEIPYQEATSSGATSTAFKDAVLSLQVTPRITADARVVMQLDVKQDTVGQIFNGIPSINTNQIRTEVLVNDGQAVVLGGIFQNVKNVSTVKTPLLGDLPGLGRLFRRDVETDDERELLVFVTPRILPEEAARQPDQARSALPDEKAALEAPVR